MHKDLADVTIIVDRSGSMASCADDAEGGVNQFVKDQKENPGDCNLTIVQFDTEYELVCNGVPVADVEEFKLRPRGATALLDAVGKSINEAGIRLDALDENNKPGLVVFVIVTDGQENSSTEFSRSQIKEMIERQQNKYSWQFTFLGANQDAFAEAGSIGISMSSTSNMLQDNMAVAYSAVSSNVSRMRYSTAGGQSVLNTYTDEEREGMVSTPPVNSQT